MPSCSPSAPIRRTWGTRIRSLILVVSRSGGRRSNLRGTGTSESGVASRGRGFESRARDAQRRRSFEVPTVKFGEYRQVTAAWQPRAQAAVSASIRRGELGDAHLPESPSACERTATRAVLLLAVADHQHVGVAAERGVADLAADRLRAVVDRDPHAEVAQFVVGAPARTRCGGRRSAGRSPAPAPARSGSGPRSARSGSRRSAPSSRAARGGSSPAGGRRRRRRCRRGRSAPASGSRAGRCRTARSGRARR